MATETRKLLEDKPEGSSEVVDHELERQDKKSSGSQAQQNDKPGKRETEDRRG